MSTSEKCSKCSFQLKAERFETGECDPMTCTVVFPEPPEWTDWMKYDNHIERSVYRDEAEKEQLRLEESQNCRLIYVRGKLVGSVDFTTDVKLRLHSETSPALVLGRRGESLYIFVYLHEWER